MTEKYVKVSVILIARTGNAILVDINPVDNPEVNQKWIPLSLIHGADERNLGRDHSTDQVTFRLMEWKAKELGL